MTLSGKTVLITGAGHGIGAAIAQRLARSGMRVAITYRNDSDGAKKVAKQCRQNGAVIKTYRVANLLDEEQVSSLFAAVVKDFGHLDVAVANAGNVGNSATTKENLHDLNLGDWCRDLNANLLVAVTTAKYAIKAMNSNHDGGKLVMIGSLHGMAEGSPRITAYSAAKAATHNFARTIAKALAPKIIVNTVAPGRCWAVGYELLSKDEVVAKFDKNRHGRPIEWDGIAQAVQMVLENDSIIGQTVVVDAGLSFLNT